MGKGLYYPPSRVKLNKGKSDAVCICYAVDRVYMEYNLSGAIIMTQLTLARGISPGVRKLEVVLRCNDSCARYIWCLDQLHKIMDFIKNLILNLIGMTRDT